MDAIKAADAFHYALKSNDSWANYKGHQNPAFFEKAAAGQSPKILWLGCSDSRVPETTVMGLQPGEVFVHRNIANIISPTDINSMSVIEYAVVHLKVNHVVLCGHTCCGGAAAALSDNRVGGVIDAWITPLKAIRKAHQAEINAITDDKQKAVRLAELNVEAGVHTLMSSHIIEDAITKRQLQVHGTIYDVACGRMRDLGVGTDTPAVPNKSGSFTGGSMAIGSGNDFKSHLNSSPKLASRPRRAGLDGADDEPEIVEVKGNHGMLKFEGEEASLAVV